MWMMDLSRAQAGSIYLDLLAFMLVFLLNYQRRPDPRL